MMIDEGMIKELESRHNQNPLLETVQKFKVIHNQLELTEINETYKKMNPQLSQKY